MFRIPYYMPGWNPGMQIVDLGQGGPASHMGLLASQPRTHPTVYNVGTYGLGAMPRQVIGPTKPINVNTYSNPNVFQNLEIKGISKNPRGG